MIDRAEEKGRRGTARREIQVPLDAIKAAGAGIGHGPLNARRVGIRPTGQVDADVTVNSRRTNVVSPAGVLERLSPYNPKVIGLTGRQVRDLLVNARVERALVRPDILGAHRVPAFILRILKMDLRPAVQKGIPVKSDNPIGIGWTAGHNPVLEQVIGVLGARPGRGGSRVLDGINGKRNCTEQNRRQA